jgi:hypothetical protein
MSTASACFENIIGLSRTECPCVEDRSVDAGTSASGLYLDELEGLTIRMADAVRDCGDTGLWAMLLRARENAVEAVKADLMACLGQQAEIRRQSGRSYIGEDRRATAQSTDLRQNFHGLTIQLAKVRGGIFRIRGIGTAFKTAGTITVHVYDRYGDAPLESYTFTHPANRVAFYELPEPLELPMSHMGMANPRYWFVFEPTEGLRAMNTLIDCGCGGFAPYWSLDKPQYESPSQKAGKAWAEWAMAAGTQGGMVEERETWGTQNNTGGLLLDVDMDCDQTTTFCPDVPNYTTDNVQKVIAHAVRYKAGANLITNLLSSTNINRYTMTAGEVLEGLRSRYEKEYQARVIEYLCPELSQPHNVNRYGDCLKCRDTWGMAVSTIRLR